METFVDVSYMISKPLFILLFHIN